MSEMFRQNLDQVEVLISRRTPLENEDTEQTFKLDKPKHSLGQWIDAKDTVGQWLEAQITKIQGSNVYVHFNGWGTRWDEWIESDSPRISQFRTYTIQSPLNTFLSPYPSLEPDADDHEIPQRQISQPDLIVRYIKSFDQVRKMLVQYLQLKVNLSMQRDVVNYCNQLINSQEEIKECEEIFKEEKETLKKLNAKVKRISGQLAPILDRMGRLMTDMAPYFALMSRKERDNVIRFTRLPAIESTGRIRVYQQIPIMPNPAEINSLIELTEQRERSNGNAVQAIFLIANNLNSSSNSDTGIQTNQT
jgi:hypothetical protein